MIELRKRRKLSRYRVGKDTGIPYKTLARIENPKFPTVTRSHLRTLLAYYGPELCIEDILS
jgi:transcriptional regulator with XRE-family HTH domain